MLMAFDEGSLQRGGQVVYDGFGNVQPLVWDMLIEDDNDYDGNGIPDLTDPNLPPARPLVQPPFLTLSFSAGKLFFSLAGTAGNSYDIEQSSTLSSILWAPALSVTLSNNTPTFSFPSPGIGTTFWRAKSH
jgi:hypothetical protein